MAENRSLEKKLNETVSTAPFTILLVDNNAINLRMGSRTLNKAFPNAKVLTAKDGMEFLKKLKEGGRFDFVVLDDLMETLNGSVAILVWRMLELIQLTHKSEKEKEEFKELHLKFKIFKADIEKKIHDEEEVSEKLHTLTEVLEELTQLSAQLEVTFEKPIKESETSADDLPRLLVLAWSDTAKGHPKGYVGADARLVKPMEIQSFYEPEVMNLIKTAEKMCRAEAVEINESESKSDPILSAPVSSKKVMNSTMFHQGHEETVESKGEEKVADQKITENDVRTHRKVRD